MEGRQGQNDSPHITRHPAVILPQDQDRHDMMRQNHDKAERFGDGNTLSVPTLMRRGGSENCLDLDTTDLAGRDVSRSRPALDSLQQKILKVKEQLRIEQNLQDENVAEYLKLIGSADKQQSSRIKQVFEKKNQKTAHNIVQLQKKLEQHQRKMKECDVLNGTKHTPPPSKDLHEFPKDNLKETVVTGSGRHPHLDKVKTIGPGVSLSPPFFFSKSREIANLIRNKFGSADNIAHLKSSMETGGGLQAEGGGRVLSGSATLTSKHKYPSDDECSTETSLSVESNGHVSGSGVMGQNSGFGKEGGQEDNSRLAEAWEEIRELREAQNLLAEDIESLKTQFKCDFESITQTLQEERYRCEQLEDQLNDLTELHQNETANLKQELASIEEKMTYQVYDRARDIQESLEACQTRMGKLELQQQQQQALQLEGTDAKVLLGKCINIMLAIVTVILVCVSTAAKFSAPLMRSRLHVFGTFLCVCLLAFGWSNWEHLTCAVERMLVPR